MALFLVVIAWLTGLGAVIDDTGAGTIAGQPTKGAGALKPAHDSRS